MHLKIDLPEGTLSLEAGAGDELPAARGGRGLGTPEPQRGAPQVEPSPQANPSQGRFPGRGGPPTVGGRRGRRSTSSPVRDRSCGKTLA